MMAVELTTIAKAPFDIQSAEVIFRTSDNVDFHVFKSILALASPLFNDMFSLDQPPPTTNSRTQTGPIVVSEESETIDALLRLCYPITNPQFQTLTHVGNVIEAATKYQMSEARRLAVDGLLAFVDTDPLQLFAISCRMRLEEHAKTAAHAWYLKAKSQFSDSVKEPFNSTTAGASYSPHYSGISCGDYFRLIEYCRANAVKPLSTFPTSSAEDHDAPDTVATTSIDIFPEAADIIFRASDGVEFAVHTLILRMAFAEALLQLPTMLSEIGTPLIQVDMPAWVLASFLKLCYRLPNPISTSGDLRIVRALIQVAETYEMPKFMSTLQELMASGDFVKTQPLSVYFISVGVGWKTHAQEAARYTLPLDLTGVYNMNMEYVPAKAYYDLLKYHHTCRSSVLGVVRSHCSNATSTMLNEMVKSVISPSWMSKEFPDSLALPAVAIALRRSEDAVAAAGRRRKKNSWITREYSVTVPSMTKVVESNHIIQTEIQNTLLAVRNHLINYLLVLTTRFCEVDTPGRVFY